MQIQLNAPESMNIPLEYKENMCIDTFISNQRIRSIMNGHKYTLNKNLNNKSILFCVHGGYKEVTNEVARIKKEIAEAERKQKAEATIIQFIDKLKK